MSASLSAVGSAGQKCAAEISRFTASYFQMDIHVDHCLRKIGVHGRCGSGRLAAIMLKMEHAVHTVGGISGVAASAEGHV